MGTRDTSPRQLEVPQDTRTERASIKVQSVKKETDDFAIHLGAKPVKNQDASEKTANEDEYEDDHYDEDEIMSSEKVKSEQVEEPQDEEQYDVDDLLGEDD